MSGPSLVPWARLLISAGTLIHFFVIFGASWKTWPYVKVLDALVQLVSAFYVLLLYLIFKR